MAGNALVLDASVVIKWFTNEKDRDIAVKLREKYIEGEIELAAGSRDR